MKAIVVGLTGQTGAGKSTVAGYLEELGCGVINADAVAREAVKSGSECLKKLAGAFGEDVINEDGSCNRRLLAKRAFSSRENTELLNSLTHPWIIARTKEYIDSLCHKGYDMIIFDAPQLFESGGDAFCDSVISVTAPESLRKQRIMDRDGISAEAAGERMNAQHPEEYYVSRSDYLIDGSAAPEEVRRSAEKIFEDIRNKTGSTQEE